MKDGTKKVQRKQKRLFLALIIGVGLLALGFGYLVVGDTRYAPQQTPTATIDLPADKMHPQDIWMNRVESQNKVIDQKLKYLEEVVLEKKKQEGNQEKEKKELKKEIIQLKGQLKEHVLPVETLPNPEDPFFSTPMEIITQPTYVPLVEFIMDDPSGTIGDVAHTIPAGTTVKALLVSSVDADCGVYSNSDPIPVKLRILDDGHLPKEVDVTLKGGILIGSAYGNLSSERVYMRLERLTQVKKDGKFVETEVAGYVSGEDGKYGVRGVVVDKSEKIVKNAAVSGFFGEASQILQSAVGRYTVDNNLSTNQYSLNDTFKPGPMGRSSNAFDMLSDYYIKRAEQVKPVIQVNAGRVIDITFTHGTEIGELHTQDKVRAVRETHRSRP